MKIILYIYTVIHSLALLLIAFGGLSLIKMSGTDRAQAELILIYLVPFQFISIIALPMILYKMNNKSIEHKKVTALNILGPWIAFFVYIRLATIF